MSDRGKDSLELTVKAEVAEMLEEIRAALEAEQGRPFTMSEALTYCVQMSASAVRQIRGDGETSH